MIKIRKNLLVAPPYSRSGFDVLHATANFLFPSGFHVGGEISILFGQFQPYPRECAAFPWDQRQCVFRHV
jgi:hypothetical protein